MAESSLSQPLTDPDLSSVYFLSEASNTDRRAHSITASECACDLLGSRCNCFGFTLAVEFPQDNRITVKKGSAGSVILA